MRQAAARLVKLTEDEEAAALRELARQSMPVIDEAYKIGPLTRWFAVYTHPRAEKKVVDGLKRHEIGCYVPIAATWRKQSKRQIHQRQPKVRVERPAWPSYVFVALPVELRMVDGAIEDIRAPFEILRQTDGVCALVSEGERPFVIPSAAIEELREREAQGDFDDTIRKSRRIVAPKWVKVGSAVRIADGPFASFNGIVEEVLPHDMVKVGVFMLGRVTPIEIEIERIKPL
jgi:transcriptional antiterminator NusG